MPSAKRDKEDDKSNAKKNEKWAGKWIIIKDQGTVSAVPSIASLPPTPREKIRIRKVIYPEKKSKVKEDDRDLLSGELGNDFIPTSFFPENTCCREEMIKNIEKECCKLPSVAKCCKLPNKKENNLKSVDRACCRTEKAKNILKLECPKGFESANEQDNTNTQLDNKTCLLKEEAPGAFFFQSPTNNKIKKEKESSCKKCEDQKVMLLEEKPCEIQKQCDNPSNNEEHHDNQPCPIQCSATDEKQIKSIVKCPKCLKGVDINKISQHNNSTNCNNSRTIKINVRCGKCLKPMCAQKPNIKPPDYKSIIANNQPNKNQQLCCECCNIQKLQNQKAQAPMKTPYCEECLTRNTKEEEPKCSFELYDSDNNKHNMPQHNHIINRQCERTCNNEDSSVDCSEDSETVRTLNFLQGIIQNDEVKCHKKGHNLSGGIHDPDAALSKYKLYKYLVAHLVIFFIEFGRDQ